MIAASNEETIKYTVIDNFDLSSSNTFGMKVRCAHWVSYNCVEGLLQALKLIDRRRFLHIGGGSNLLFTRNFDGFILHSDIKSYSIINETDTHVFVNVGSGVVFDDLIADMCAKNFWGIENLSAIPGEAGAAAVQNIGAYGVEAKDVITQVECVDIDTGKIVTFDNSECKYAYRDSLFKHEKNRYIVVSVTIKLSKIAQPRLDYGNLAAVVGNENVSPLTVRNAVRAIRDKKLPSPDKIGSAGSFFKNPIIDKTAFDHASELSHRNDIPFYNVGDCFKIPAAWLIEQCGWKGKTHGGAAVWHLQPLVIVNNSHNALPSDIIALENDIIKSVHDKFGIVLQPEVEHI
jgi:UDP-N-acetylmuramate dehydrogenase